MGRLIDEDVLIDSIPDLNVFEQEDFGTPDMIRLIEDAPTVEAIPKADYENRLKADLVAILTELQLKIEEIKPLEPTDDEDWQYGCFHGLELMQDKCLKLIQQKINSLKEAKDGENNN